MNPHRLNVFALWFCAFALAACGLIDEGIDKAFEDMELLGTWEDDEGLVIEGVGDGAIVVDFGNSILGTNPGLIDIGDFYIRGLEGTAEGVWEGEIVAPGLDEGTLVDIAYEGARVEIQGGSLRLTRDDGKVTAFSPSKAGNEEPEEPKKEPKEPADWNEKDWSRILITGSPWEAVSVIPHNPSGSGDGEEELGRVKRDWLLWFNADKTFHSKLEQRFTEDDPWESVDDTGTWKVSKNPGDELEWYRVSRQIRAADIQWRFQSFEDGELFMVTNGWGHPHPKLRFVPHGQVELPSR